MRVLKFGGSSLATPDAIGSVVDIVRRAAEREAVIVVVSALGGITNRLGEAADASATGAVVTAADVLDRHIAAVAAVTDPAEHAELEHHVRLTVDELHDLLRGVSLVNECSHRTRDLILSFGERLAAVIVAAALRRVGLDAVACDARPLIRTDERHGTARVDTTHTYESVRTWHGSLDAIPVVTGFIGSNASGDTTTLGRGGSDFTASLIGAALAVDAVEIWTDVDGVMRADPRMVPGAAPIDQMTYDELMELSHFGAKVVYPPTVHPARLHSIPLVIRNTFHPQCAGTRIARDAAPGPDVVRGISSINDVTLLRLEGDGMIGVPGIAARLFGALAREEINIILISQASSEHSICFAVPPAAVEPARRQVDTEFALERAAGLIDDLVVEPELAIIAVVGAQMRERPGIAGRLFGILGQRGINVRAIAQGSSELNISLVVARADEPVAVQAMYEAFYTP